MFALLLAAQMVGPPAPDVAPVSDVRVPIIGLEGPNADACVGVARISTFDGKESVRERPDEAALETDKLPHKALVWLCEAEGEWQGIVYPSGPFQEMGDCRVSSAVAESRPYDGPCKSGWVLGKHLQQVAW